MSKERRRLTDLIQEETQNILPRSDVTESVNLEKTSNPEPLEQQSYRVAELQSLEVTEYNSETREKQTTDIQSDKLPKYLRMERKEARLRQEQIDALTDITRKLNRMKRGKSDERLTDNTLIRVAIDLLLSRANELQGTTEADLLRSLNL